MEDEEYEEFEDQDDPDEAFERFLENVGHDEAMLQEEMEALSGITDPWR